MRKKKMRLIEKSVCEVESTKNGRKVWRVKEHPDESVIGNLTCCGLPKAQEYPIGTRYTIMIEVPLLINEIDG